MPEMSLTDRISVKARFFYLIAVILIFTLISGLTLLHTMNSIAELGKLENEYNSNFDRVHQIDHQLEALIVSMADSTRGSDAEIAALMENIALFRNELYRQTQHRWLRQSPEIQSSSAEILKYINALEGVTGELISGGSRPAQLFSAVHARYVDPVIRLYAKIREQLFDTSFGLQRRYALNLFIVLFLSLVFITVFFSVNEVSNYLNIRRLMHFSDDLDRGNREEKIHLSGAGEFTEISAKLNSFLEKQQQKTRFLKTIAQAEEPDAMKTGEDDILGKEIGVLADHLKAIREEEKVRQNEDQKKHWMSDGIAEFAEILRSERENVKELSFLVIQKLVTYLQVEMGTIFLTSDIVGNRDHLETIAAYAYDRRKYIDRTFAFGEGLPGTCALDKEKIYIDDIPEDYSDVISGVGQTRPRYVLLVPLKIDNEILGILEMASFRSLEPFELEFVDQLADSIASTLSAVKTNERTASLLRQSQEQAEKLLRQEEEMKLNMEKLENAQVESLKKESEITGILNAMNESSLVAEYNLNGRFTHINKKFLDLIESPEEMILGRHHNEFAIVDRYSGEYKKFWKDLKEGLSISREEQFRLFSGKEIWLQQTYTPIRNQEGNIFKILNIAVDITQAKKQQEHLEQQATEISRQKQEMESLDEAVNSSIIKAELDHEGIIIDINTNFEDATGLNRKEILGRNNRLFLKDAEKEQFDRIWQEMLRGKTWEGATRRTKPTGEEVWLMSTYSPVKNEEEKIYKIYMLAQDITEKKLKYQLLEDANREIERLRNDAKK